MSRQCCIPRCTLLSACSALLHGAPFFDCTLQAIGNSFSPKNWHWLWVEFFSPFWLILGLPALSPGHNSSKCFLIKAVWREVPDSVLPRPCRGPSQLIDMGCLQCVQASLAGNLLLAISLSTSHSCTATTWPSHVHSSTWNNILVVAANPRPQRNKQARLKTELLTLRLTESLSSLSVFKPVAALYFSTEGPNVFLV